MKTCCICQKQFDGYGNNARPIMLGLCCDRCNAEYVIPYRLAQQHEEQIRAAADNLAVINKHGSAWLNAYVGKLVVITMYDDSVKIGVLHVDTPAIRSQTYVPADNKEVIGYYLHRIGRGELHFRKSHVKKIMTLKEYADV